MLYYALNDFKLITLAVLLIVNLANKAWDFLAVLFVLRIYPTKCVQGFPGGTSGKEPACQYRRQRNVGLIPEEGHGNPLQYSFLKNSKDRGGWQAIVHRGTELDKTEHICTSLQMCTTICPKINWNDAF